MSYTRRAVVITQAISGREAGAHSISKKVTSLLRRHSQDGAEWRGRIVCAVIGLAENQLERKGADLARSQGV